MTEDLEKVQLQTSNKRKYIVMMGVVLGVFVTLSSVGAGAFGNHGFGDYVPQTYQ